MPTTRHLPAAAPSMWEEWEAEGSYTLLRSEHQTAKEPEGGRTNSRAKTARVDLGLALLSVLRRSGEALTAHDIAAWCDCSPQTISRIERRALAKVRRRLEEMSAWEQAGQDAGEAPAHLSCAA